MAFGTGSSGPVFFSLGVRDSLLVILVVNVMYVYHSIHDLLNFLIRIFHGTFVDSSSLIELSMVLIFFFAFVSRTSAIPAYLCVLENNGDKSVIFN